MDFASLILPPQVWSDHVPGGEEGHPAGGGDLHLLQLRRTEGAHLVSGKFDF